MEMKNILVIGGSGFLGAALISGLKKSGFDQVRCFDLNPCPDSDVESIIGDLCNPEQVLQACAGVDTVFQTAALVDWGSRSRERLMAVNVRGNRNVIEACHKQGVTRLIYTSSVDVVFDGTPISNGDEQQPYPKQHLDDYSHTKALAEQDILHANQPRGLQTCALRAAGIYGPGDRHRFPPILKAARQGKMIYLGDGSARFNHIYITNLVEAHIRAALALQQDSLVSGQAYFITDHEPGNFYDFVTPYLTALGYPVPGKRIPDAFAYGLALMFETLARLGVGPQPPLLTRYVMLSTCRDFYFKGIKARNDFGYRPTVSPEQAFDETLAWLKEQA
ncbi:MAG: NAD-dependent epimerase/dehydratase family protein [Anaerolineales bacterium]|nr:NAD-dependent epimerase/dehydratase family protein [Anaerolineales bacterium]